MKCHYCFALGLMVLVPALTALADATPSWTETPDAVVASDGARLSAVWTVPSLPARGVVVLVQGSGNVGADGDVSGPMTGHGHLGAPAKLSEQLAHAFGQAGIASLRYAKRGFDDAAQRVNQTEPYLERDLASAIAAARTRFPALKTGVVGFSEGALVSLRVAGQTPVDALFLLSLPTRSVDEFASYQFVGWPVSLLSSRLDTDHDGVLSAQELSRLTNPDALPVMGTPWESLDPSRQGSLSIATQVVPAYEAFFHQILGLLSTPDYAGWYQALRALPSFEQTASAVSVPTFLYQAMDDAQLSWNWVVEDQRWLKNVKSLKVYSGLGHAFAPMEGSIGQVKTSGPFDEKVVSDLVADVTGAIAPSR